MEDLLFNLQVWSADAIALATSELGLVTEGSLGAGGLVSSLVYYRERYHSRSLPMLPSHEQALEGEGNPGTRFFAAVHDLAMTVTEAWNMVRSRGKRIEEVIRREELADVVDRIENGAEELLTFLDPYAESFAQLDVAWRQVRALWTYRSRDNYRTETYTVTTRDSEGRSRVETRTRQVYLNTDHWFTYDESKLSAARESTTAWITAAANTTFPTLDLDQHHVELDNLDPAQRSFLERLVKSTVTRTEEEIFEVELEELVNQWLLGTRVCRDLEGFVHMADVALSKAGGVFKTTEGSEAKYRYTTTSRTHHGPPGYSATRSLLATLDAGHAHWLDVLAVVDGARAGAQRLLTFATDPEQVESDLEYAQVAVEVYQLAFPDSTLELDRLPNSWLAAGAGAGTTASVWVGYVVYGLWWGGW